MLRFVLANAETKIKDVEWLNGWIGGWGIGLRINIHLTLLLYEVWVIIGVNGAITNVMFRGWSYIYTYNLHV